MRVPTSRSAHSPRPPAARRQAAGGLRRAAAIPAWPPSYALLATFAGAAPVTVVVVLAGGTRHPGAALAAYAGLAFAASLPAPLLATPGIATIAWLFDNGFITDRHAVLGWHGTADWWRLGILLGAAAAGFVLAAPARVRRREPVEDGGGAERADGTAGSVGGAGVQAWPPGGHTDG